MYKYPLLSFIIKYPLLTTEDISEDSLNETTYQMIFWYSGTKGITERILLFKEFRKLLSLSGI